MSSRTTTIEVNGKRYDARTGALVAPKSDNKPTSQAPAKHQNKGKVMDGVVRTKARPARTTPVNSVQAGRSKTIKSKTLMRSAVKKPTLAQQKAATPHIIRRATLVLSPSKDRLQRAKQVKKSSLVNKFGGSQSAVKVNHLPLLVKPEPSAPPINVPKTKKTAKIAGSTVHKNIFEKAVEKSESHRQAKPKKLPRSHRAAHKLKVSPRVLNLAASSLAAVLLIGFVAYQNVPNLSMRVAATRAGIDGRLPDYHPAGFGLSGPIEYRPGQITLQYASRSDNRNFKVSQRASQWNSDTLLEHYVAPNSQQYQEIKDSGKTIFVYDDGNATWVDGGVWYEIDGNSILSNDQLVRMAASL